MECEEDMNERAPQLWDFLSMKKFREIGEQDFYSPQLGRAYCVRSVYSELNPNYFKFWNRCVRKMFRCQSTEQNLRHINPLTMNVLFVGIPSAELLAEYEENIILEAYTWEKGTLRVEGHYFDEKAGKIEYAASRAKMERNFTEQIREF